MIETKQQSAVRLAQGVVELPCGPAILGQAAVGGKTESEGPLGQKFAEIFPHSEMDEKCWEMAETRLQQAALQHAMVAAACEPASLDLHLGGDLLNQCSASNFTMRDSAWPFAGLYSACATFAQSLALGALMLAGGGLSRVSACASSHFCAAEKQFRYPLEYGGQPSPSTQRTATAAGAVVLGAADSKRRTEVSHVIFGQVTDLGVTDANEMGAAMAPAAWDTIRRFLDATHTAPQDYDCILTGDLGGIGSALLLELAQREGQMDLSGIHRDGGLLLYHAGAQDAGMGGSGAGCSAAVICADILPRMHAGELKNVLFIGTGALLSATSPLQGESIPAVAHGVLITSSR